jgi:hypothetical protein
MKLIFMYRNKTYGRTRGFYDLELEAWLQNDNTVFRGNKESEFTLIERIRIFINKNTDTEYHSCEIKHFFGEDSCEGHSAKSIKEFLYYQTDLSFKLYQFKIINQRDFERLKSTAFKIYNKYRSVDYEKLKSKGEPFVRRIF